MFSLHTKLNSTGFTIGPIFTLTSTINRFRVSPVLDRMAVLLLIEASMIRFRSLFFRSRTTSKRTRPSGNISELATSIALLLARCPFLREAR